MLDSKARTFADAEVHADSGAIPESVLAEPVTTPVIEETVPRTKRSARLPLLIAGPIVAVVIALAIYLYSGRYESTDDAYLQSGLVSVSPSISGRVVSVDVRENGRVHVGQVLFRIDPAPFQAEVDQAQASLADARAQVGAMQANYEQGGAEIKAAQDQYSYASREVARQKQLLDEGISSQSQYDQAVLAQQNSQHGIVSAQKKSDSVLASLAGNAGGPVDAQPGVQRAQAALDQARLNLGYTVIRASQDGIVTKVNQLQVGDYVSASKPVFTLAGVHLWVEANFKEDQLDHMRVGQKAALKVDAFPSLRLTGKLATFSPGTGNSFALLPAENATGNWVKVVQRLPVEFDIDRLPPDLPLHAGLSVEVTVDTGYQRHMFGPGNTAAR
jgi:membrane fusion protein (multidrug efflux system)